MIFLFPNLAVATSTRAREVRSQEEKEWPPHEAVFHRVQEDLGQLGRRYNSEKQDGHDIAATNTSRRCKELVDGGVIDGLLVDCRAFELLGSEYGKKYVEEVSTWRSKFYSTRPRRDGDDRSQPTPNLSPVSQNDCDPCEGGGDEVPQATSGHPERVREHGDDYDESRDRRERNE